MFPRLPTRLLTALAAASLLTSPFFAGTVTANAATVCNGTKYGDLCLLSTSQWTESIAGVEAVHLIGELRNDGTSNLTGIHLSLQLATATGPLPASADSTVQVLAPSGKTPFETVLFPPPPGYTGFSVSSIATASSTNQPAHNFTVALKACPAGSPAQEICGQVTNNSTTITVDDVAAILTYYNGSGTAIAQDRIVVDDGTGGSTLAPGQTSGFSQDRTGAPTYSSLSMQAEPDYPIDLNPSSVTFPGQRVGTTSSSSGVTLSNNGPRSVSITQVSTTGDFAQTNSCGTSVASAASCQINVTFHPTAAGLRSGTLTITDLAAGTAQRIPLSGTGTLPAATLSPTSIAFTSVQVGTTGSSQPVTLTDTGNAPLTINAITIDPNFIITNQNCPAVLDVAAQCEIDVAFSPSKGGPLSGHLSVADDAPGSPQQVALSGTGLGPGIQLSPTSVDFGNQNAGVKSSLRQVTLTNSGTLNLTISSISTSANFQQTNNCGTVPGATLAPSASCLISVSFTPDQSGPYAGTLTVTGNAPSQSVSLSGTGVGPPAATYGVSSTTQYSLAGSNGVDWTDIDPAHLAVGVPPLAANGRIVISGNADLWTERAGVNQDIGLFVSQDGGPDQLVAWKESGGFAGTFSPNAAFVQITYPVSVGSSYQIKLKWKTNVATTATIHSGAGLAPNNSPTALNVKVLPSGIMSASSTSQYSLAGNDGATWQNIDVSRLQLTIPSSKGTRTALLSGNADLWTERPGVNQDLGIFVSTDGGPDQLVAWKESGGFAGTFSPNAAFVQTAYPLLSGSTYTVSLKWKTNVATTGSIHAAAGLGPVYSPTALTAQVLGSGISAVSSSKQYALRGNDGATWQNVDSGNLSMLMPIVPNDETVLVSANADLWTENAGVNQDLGIFVSTGSGPAQLIAWKESGGFAGTFSPNAAFVQIAFRAQAGVLYTFTLKWKTNVPTDGTIHAAAGVGPQYSPTNLTVEQLPSS